MAKYRITGEVGVPCIKCGRTTQVREHTHITSRHLNQPYYFTKWFNCTNSECKTTIFMEEKYKVYNNNKASREIKEKQEYNEQLSFIRNI